MANVQQVDYTRIEGNKEEVTASGQGTTASPPKQQPATVPQPVMVPQPPVTMAAPPPAGVQYMLQTGAVQYMPQSGVLQYTPQVGAVQYVPQAGRVQFIQQPVQPLTQVRIYRREQGM